MNEEDERHERRKASCRKYYRTHKEQVKATHKLYREAHREELRLKQREYNKRRYRDHAGEIKTRAQLYHAAHREVRLRQQREYAARERVLVLEHYGGRCACCGETEIKFLAIDHIDNNGSKHRRSIGRSGGTSFYHWIIKHNFPEGLQVLCHNCNMTKGFYGTCPRQERKV